MPRSIYYGSPLCYGKINFPPPPLISGIHYCLLHHVFLCSDEVSTSASPWARKTENRGPNRKNREPEPNRTETENFGSISVPSSQEPKILGSVSVPKPINRRTEHITHSAHKPIRWRKAQTKP